MLPPIGAWVIDATVPRDMGYIPFCASLVDDAGDDDSNDGNEDEWTNHGHDEDPRRGAAVRWPRGSRRRPRGRNRRKRRCGRCGRCLRHYAHLRRVSRTV